MTAPGPMGGVNITDVCDCRCHRTADDVLCNCRDCGGDLDE